MLLRNSLQSLTTASIRASPNTTSSILVSAFKQLSIGSTSTSTSQVWQHGSIASCSQQYFNNPQLHQIRTKTSLTPRRTKYRKAFKGRVPVHTGGSTAGTTLEHGEFGLRVKDRPTRLTAKQLHSAHEALRRGIKPIKGSQIYLRVFPDIPVCIKGNETRMGKGKGTFEYWACRAPIGKVIFEVGGGGIGEQVAKDALRLASAKLPVLTEFITRSTPPRLGNVTVDSHLEAANSSSLPSRDNVTVPIESLVQPAEVPTA